MTAQPIGRPARAWRGCVVDVEPGVFTVLAETRGDTVEIRATLDGRMLGVVARDRSRMPEKGDWVTLRRWPDHHVTVTSVIRPEISPPARVLPFRAR